MVYKIVGMVLFLIVIILNKMYYSQGWWDSASFIVVLSASVFVWMVYFFLKRKWDFFAKNVSVFLGIMYSLIWGISLIFAGKESLIYPLITIPTGYGLILGVISNYVYARRRKSDRKID